MTTLRGQGVSPGVAVGPLVFFRREGQCVEKRTVSDIPAELRRLELARRQAAAQLEALYSETVASLGEENAQLFQIHQMILEDPDLCGAIEALIQSEGVCAAYAVEQASRTFSDAFSAMESAYMRARSADVLDVSRRLLRALTGAGEGGLPSSTPAIVASDDLAPSETARLDPSTALAFVTGGGSRNSHTAIFARTMGIPAVVGLGASLSQALEGRTAAVDGSTGEVFLDPTPEILSRFRQRAAEAQRRRTLAEHFRGKPTLSRGGRRIELCANVGCLSDVEEALRCDAEGIGLFRSEFLYLNSDDYPDEETQLAAYRAAVEQMDGRRVVIRTMDIGADKQAAYFNLPHEDNPAMGLRAIRICLTRPALFATQLRALYRASAHGKLAIMLPMISHPDEVRQAKAIAAEVQDALRREGIPFRPDTELGIMIETPAAALLSDALAQEVDFFSVGTNDLTQYTLALDRQNSALAPFDDPQHTAVLKLIAMAAESAHRAGIWIGICGELGADQALTDAFLEMGIDELSVAPASILSLRAHISTLP